MFHFSVTMIVTGTRFLKKMRLQFISEYWTKDSNQYFGHKYYAYMYLLLALSHYQSMILNSIPRSHKYDPEDLLVL